MADTEFKHIDQLPVSESVPRQGKSSSTTWLTAAGLVLFDIAATYVSYFLAAWGTLRWEASTEMVGTFGALGILAVINVAVFAIFRMYRSMWRYASIRECLHIVIASVVASIASSLVFNYVLGGHLSLRIYLMAWALLLLMVGGVRLGIRMFHDKQVSPLANSNLRLQPKTLIVGVGETGSLTIKRMHAGDPDMPGSPVVAVDDDPSKLGRYCHGVKVAGTTADIPRLAREYDIKQIVFACPSATKSQRQRVYDICMETGLKLYTLPNVRDIPTEELGRLAFHDVQISDLLSRDEVKLDDTAKGYVAGRVVLVTGGGGSIGSELVRQLLPAKPQQIVLFDIYENTTYELYHEIKKQCDTNGIDVQTEIGSITNEDALREVFETYRPHVVFHAAAHKHVPLMEKNCREAVANNVFGTLNVAHFADAFGCERFIFISTDKAVNPANVMGATKRMGEMIMQYYAAKSDTIFTAVRFGNVLGSHGSVIPLFQRQLADGGPITLTHKDITRYFMTIPEASRLVITAGALAKGGEIFVLNMGEPVKIYDLAVNLITLSGLKVGRDIEIIETGLRPGEKMYEELLMDSEGTIPTENSDIMVSKGVAPDVELVHANLKMLNDALIGTDEDVKRRLADAVPTFTPQW